MNSNKAEDQHSKVVANDDMPLMRNDNLEINHIKPIPFTQKLRGLHRHVWTDGAAWLKMERDSWADSEIATVQLESAIHRAEHCLQAFEHTYGMSTTAFLKRLAQDDLQQCDDYDDWVGEARMLARLREKLMALQDFRGLTSLGTPSPSLASVHEPSWDSAFPSTIPAILCQPPEIPESQINKTSGARLVFSVVWKTVSQTCWNASLI